MPSLDQIRSALEAHAARRIEANGRLQAAVAMVLRETRGAPQVLLIERAERAGDPWSGHMAFPGGRREPADPHERSTAERETLEEVGVCLDGARDLGRLDDMQGRGAAGQGGLVVSAFVYLLEEAQELVLNHEVREAFWFPLDELRAPERHVDHRVEILPGTRFPGIQVGAPGRHVVWGLTYRFLEHFFEVVGKPLPPRA